jgi:hypothetical protein
MKQTGVPRGDGAAGSTKPAIQRCALDPTSHSSRFPRPQSSTIEFNHDAAQGVSIALPAVGELIHHQTNKTSAASLTC